MQSASFLSKVHLELTWQQPAQGCPALPEHTEAQAPALPVQHVLQPAMILSTPASQMCGVKASILTLALTLALQLQLLE